MATYLFFTQGADAQWMELLKHFAALHDSETRLHSALTATQATSALGGEKPAVVVCFEDFTQRVAVKYKHASRAIVHVVRIRKTGEQIAKTAENKAFHCRECSINFFYDRQGYEKNWALKRERRFLALDNPFCLESQKANRNVLFSYALEALLRPCACPTNEQLKEDFGHIELSYVTHFYFNQKSPKSIFDLLETYARYDRSLREKILFVLVDDGSSVEYTVPELPLNILWLRITRDIPWNQAGARNLGMTYAKSDKVVLTDIDHIFPEETLRGLVKARPCGRRFYKFHRKTDEGKLRKGHPNIFYLSRGRFFELFGYDEEFGGAYGAEDYRFVKYQKACGSWQRYFPKRYFIHENKVDREKSYHTLTRDLSLNTPIDSRKRAEMETYGHKLGHSRMFLNFEWQLVSKQFLRPRETPKIDKTWKYLSWVRTLFPTK